jgi:2-polyprenyl-3-methyl-5-hydroxy-6-metoxy-1,4-benzoquinol methylase
MLFKKPYYKCRLRKTYLVDVTLSAPPQTQHPSIIGDLVLYLRHLEKSKKVSVSEICDFGAGKLRNTRAFLEKDFNLCAVEYERQFKDYKKSEEMLNQIKHDYPKNFKQIVFPDQFIKSALKFDVILLFYVLHIVPYPKHRDYIIKHCSSKLSKNGLVFIGSPGYDTNMRRHCISEFKYRDGWLLHVHEERQTFYTEFDARKQLDPLMAKHGFRLKDSLKFGKNQARVYEKD